MRQPPGVSMLTLNAAAVSYGLGGMLFGIFTVLMLTAWRGRLQGGAGAPANAGDATPKRARDADLN